MNRVLPEMLNCTDMTVLERQRARLGNEQEQFHHQTYFNELSGVISSQSSHGHGFQGGFMDTDSGLGEMVMVKPDPGLDNGWHDLGTIEMPDSGIPFGPPCGYGNGTNFEMKYTMTRMGEGRGRSSRKLLGEEEEKEEEEEVSFHVGPTPSQQKMPHWMATSVVMRT